MKRLLALSLIAFLLIALSLACSKKEKEKADTQEGRRETAKVATVIPPVRAESNPSGSITNYKTATNMLFKKYPDAIKGGKYHDYTRQKLTKGEAEGAVYVRADALKSWRDMLSVNARDNFAAKCIRLADGAEAGVYREPLHVRDPIKRLHLYEVAFNFAISDELKIKAFWHYRQVETANTARENWDKLNKQKYVSPKMRRCLRLHPRRWDKPSKG